MKSRKTLQIDETSHQQLSAISQFGKTTMGQYLADLIRREYDLLPEQYKSAHETLLRIAG